jgi:hypothetical protein
MDTSYLAIAKGRGFVYAFNDQLYKQVKRRGNVVYLKCYLEPCDGSAKIENGELKLLVRTSVKEITHTCAEIFDQYAL